MKTQLWTLLAAAALIGAPAGLASGPAGAKAVATVEFLNPENFTDFRLSEIGTESEQRQLSTQLRQEITRLAATHLPVGYHVMVRFNDIDLAGDYEPFRSGRWQDVRILRSIYPPRLNLDYSVTDAAGNLVASGQRSLSDTTYQWRLRMGPWSETQIENDLLADFFRDLRREIS